MSKPKKLQKSGPYWLRDEPALPWVQPWEPEEKPVQWTLVRLQLKMKVDELLSLFRQRGNRLHLFRAIEVLSASKEPIPTWMTKYLIEICEKMRIYGENRDTNRIRDAAVEILWVWPDHHLVGHSVFSEADQATRERTIYHEVTKRRYDPERPGLLMKQIYGEVEDIVRLKPAQVARIYRQLLEQIDGGFQVEEIAAQHV
jgi:hypothetical protein